MIKMKIMMAAVAVTAIIAVIMINISDEDIIQKNIEYNQEPIKDNPDPIQETGEEEIDEDSNKNRSNIYLGDIGLKKARR